MQIAVVIVTFNRERDLSRALRSVRRQCGVEFETIVADNGSVDGTIEMLRRDFPEVRMIEMKANTGMKAHNAALQAAGAPYVFLMDNDMVLVEDDVLARSCRALDENSGLGAAAARVWDLDRSAGGLALRLSGNSPKHVLDGEVERGYETSAFDGGAVALRVSATLQAGGFCEEFFLYHGEVDLSTRLKRCGWDVRFFPQMSVIHCHSPVSRSASLHSYLATRNYFLYLYRNYPVGRLLPAAWGYLWRSAEQALLGRRRFFPWLRGAAAGLLLGWRVPGREPVPWQILRHQQEIQVLDRLRKEKTGEMLDRRAITESEIVRLGLDR